MASSLSVHFFGFSMHERGWKICWISASYCKASGHTREYMTSCNYRRTPLEAHKTKMMLT